jgi:YidC/Oxa1 family membrane protein insertase
MAIVESVLFPIIWAMGLVLSALHAVTGSYGLAIVGLSLIVRLITIPIVRLAERAEERDRAIQAKMAPEIEQARREASGRERFERIDAIYQAHGYHPIKSVLSILPMMLQLPFLLSALFLLVDLPALSGERFLFIPDLAAADGLAGGINLLPLLIAGISLAESAIKPGLTRGARLRYLVVMIVIVALIYPLPAGVCLYWLTTNVWSLASTLVTIGRGRFGNVKN